MIETSRALKDYQIVKPHQKFIIQPTKQFNRGNEVGVNSSLMISKAKENKMEEKFRLNYQNS